MYESLVFAPLKDRHSVTEVDEALKLATEYVVTPTEVRLGDLQINNNATITNGEPRAVTVYGFEHFCKILGIPNPFARAIPPDLLFTNIERLKAEKADANVVLLERPNGEIANIVKAPYDELSYLDVIGMVAADSNVKYFDIGEQLLTVGLVFDELPVAEVDTEDPLYVGMHIYSSITKLTGLQMVSSVYRTQCENSFLAPYLAKLRANYLLEKDERTLKFMESLRNIDEVVYQRMKTNIGVLQEQRTLFEHELVYLWKRIAKIVSSAEADLILTLNEESRDPLFKKVSAWSSSNKRARLTGEAVEEATLTEVSAYTTLNEVTSYAKKLHEMERRNLEKVAGQLVQSIILN